jgi:hypothetical protein
MYYSKTNSMKEDEMVTCGSNVNVIGVDLRGGKYGADSTTLEW